MSGRSGREWRESEEEAEQQKTSGVEERRGARDVVGGGAGVAVGRGRRGQIQLCLANTVVESLSANHWPVRGLITNASLGSHCSGTSLIVAIICGCGVSAKSSDLIEEARGSRAVCVVHFLLCLFEHTESGQALLLVNTRFFASRKLVLQHRMAGL